MIIKLRCYKQHKIKGINQILIEPLYKLIFLMNYIKNKCQVTFLNFKNQVLMVIVDIFLNLII